MFQRLWKKLMETAWIIPQSELLPERDDNSISKGNDELAEVINKLEYENLWDIASEWFTVIWSQSGDSVIIYY